MADVLSGNVRSLQETLRSKSPHKASRAAQLSSDLYQLCVESVTYTELGTKSRDIEHHCLRLDCGLIINTCNLTVNINFSTFSLQFISVV